MKKSIWTALLVGCAGVAGAATITNSIIDKVNWNNAIWGTPAAAPTTGNDYYYVGGGGTWLLGYGANGDFAGDALILPTSSAIFIKGSGAANLVMQGGALQTRAAGTSTLTGTIRVDATSGFLGVDGNLNIAATISGSGDLEIGGFLAGSDGRVGAISGINDNYTGKFVLKQGGGDGYHYKIRFDASYPTAGLSFTGPNPLRAPVYQLDGDITFKSAEMPSQADPAVLLPLSDGTYTGADLMAAGVHTNYFADNGGTLIVDSTPDIPNPIIMINPNTTINTWTNWNSAIWGDPADVPTSGNDYVNNKAAVWIYMLGNNGGSFQGDKISIAAGAVVFGTGSGDLGGTLNLAGGTWQERAPTDSNNVPSAVTGNMVVSAPSRILCINGGGVEFKGSLSGSGDLTVGTFQNAGQHMVFSGTDSGYKGDFVLAQSGKDGVNDFAVIFNVSFPKAGLTYSGTAADREPVYYLTNDIQFLTAKMPSQADSAVLITLPDGFYDGAALIAAGVNTNYFMDLGGRIIVGPPSYELWAEGWNIDIGSRTDNPDGDWLDNLSEYALGGDPTDPLDRGLIPTIENDAGTMVYVHAQRTDDPSLSYHLETNDNLILGGNWVDAGYTVMGTNVTGGTFDYVTNTVPTATDKTFVRLRVEDQ